MTNAELIQKIRSEVERLENYYTSVEWYVEALLSFLDTLEKSEKPMNQDEDLNKEIKAFVNEYGYEKSEDILLIAIVARHFCELGCTRTAEKYDEIEYKRQQEEEQTCKGFEEEFRRFIKKEKEEEPDGSLPYYGDCGIYRIARHFAEWGAEHSGSPEIPNDWKKAADKEYPYEKGMNEQMLDLNAQKQAAFFKGAKWDRSKMMEEAVEGYVVKDITGSLAITAKGINLDGFKFGDKVRVIVLPKED